jgi:hypothetical protein
MSPEDLDEIRILVNRLKNVDDDNIKTILGMNAEKMLAHIDEQAAYISGLEAAYLKTEAEYLWQNSDPGYDFDKCEEMARESLERIKGGEQA